MSKFFDFKKPIILFFLVSAIISGFLLKDLRFTFDFDQFFPEGDKDLIFYREFTKEFGADDSFLLIAIKNRKTVFEKDFLKRLHQFTLAAKELPYVKESQSLTTLYYPLKTSFGYTKLPIIHFKDTTKYASDWERLQKDESFLKSFIDKEASSLIVALQTDDELNYEQSKELLSGLRYLLDGHELKSYHLLGRTFFYEALIEMQVRELIMTTIVSIILAFIVLFLVYRRFAVVLISLTSIALALILFLGLLSALGRELNPLSAFYPILMLIVGTSDVIHIMDSFIVKIRLGHAKKKAIAVTLKEVGLTTLLTSITTAIGFASLITSRLKSITDFGINSAIGVLVAYITVVLFTTSLLLLTATVRLLPKGNPAPKWPVLLVKINHFTKKNPIPILIGSLVFTIICFWGISYVNTDVKFYDNLPRGGQITSDFQFFQKNYSGFRPLEVAVEGINGNKVTDFNVVKDMDKVEAKMDSFQAIGSVGSLTTFFKTLNKANHLNKQDFFDLPKEKSIFENYKRDIYKNARKQVAKFVNKEKTKARIASRVLDVGTDSLQSIYRDINRFIGRQTDTTAVRFTLTGKGLLLDKNAIYVRKSLFQGLFMALMLISILMALLFKKVRFLLISLIPNVLPLLFAGALLGFLKIPLEASITIVFAIVFGIAVDDTIHFLGKFKICKARGLGTEAALEQTFKETGRALVVTTIILFFGFLVLLFSIYRPSVIIGLMISATLLTALVIDLLLLPVLIRKFLKKNAKKI